MADEETEFVAKYEAFVAPAVFKSISQVANAGRTKDDAKIKQEQERHDLFMKNLPGPGRRQ
jgi:hypothetical protein